MGVTFFAMLYSSRLPSHRLQFPLSFQRLSLSFHLQEKMKEKVDMILKHNINCFINRQLIYNYPEQLFADAGVMAIEHADFEGVERLALVLGKFTGVCRVILGVLYWCVVTGVCWDILRLDNCLEDILDVNIGVYRVILRDLYWYSCVWTILRYTWNM